MPAKNTKLGDRVTQAQPFTVFASKTGRVGVRIGTKRAYDSADEVIVSAAPVRITRGENGLLIAGEGVVRRHKNTIAVTA